MRKDQMSPEQRTPGEVPEDVRNNGILYIKYYNWPDDRIGSEKFEPEVVMVDDFPRRNRLDHNTPAELAIRAAVDEVEKVGAHVWLTEAVTLLTQARERLADYIDLKIKESK